MSGTIVELSWFPKYNDKFFTWGSEISLYQVKKHEEVDHNILTNINLDLSPTTTATLLATESRYQYIRCVVPSFHGNGDLLTAVGLANGKVALCNFVASTDNNVEFTPRQSRPCLCLAWNEAHTNLLAMGFDRNRSDHCITIWDTERGIPKESTILHLIGLSETANSICWDKQSRTLIAGMSHKHIKMMDLRLSNAIVTTANTRAVNGLSVAPQGRYLASYIDNIVGIWDLRNIEKPISQIQMQRNINKLSWCPTRDSVLATLQRDSPCIHMLDLHWPSAEMEGEPHSIKRYVAPFQARTGPNPRNVTIEDLSWHPSDLERLLAVSGSGNLCDFKLPQRIAISWDTGNNLWGSNGNELNRLSSPSPPTSPTDSLNHWSDNTWSKNPEDIAELIQKRALNDYGQIADIQKNGDLAQNPTLKSVWRLLAHMNREDCMLGVRTILGISSADTLLTRSETILTSWHEMAISAAIKQYRSDQRDSAQQLCGWTFDRDKEQSFMAFVDELCQKQEFTRAALIACFHLRVRFAIDILGKGADQTQDPSSLRMASIALSGFSLEKNGIWRTQCNTSCAQINDPHLRGIFAFLTPDNENFETVLSESGISLSDRMAFACMYLSDTKIAEYVRTMIASCTELGDLNGLLLTGATNEGINLLQSHLDWTEDVQTVALIAARFLSPELLSENRVQYWVSSYRDLLDMWGLWEQRSLLDIAINSVRPPPPSARSVFLLCSFCNKNVSSCVQEDARIRTNSNVNKLSSCPNCRKPLPRCSLCLLHMGTTMGFTSQSRTNSSGWQSRPFSKWYSWCQTCRHGGHTEHLAQWFSEHTECPVTSCSCKCFSMDLPMPQFPREI